MCVCVWGGGVANLSKDFCVPSEKGFTLNGKNLLPVGVSFRVDCSENKSRGRRGGGGGGGGWVGGGGGGGKTKNVSFVTEWQKPEVYPQLNVYHMLKRQKIYKAYLVLDWYILHLTLNWNSSIRATSWMCAQWRLRSTWASAQSDQSLCCALHWVDKDPPSLISPKLIYNCI